MKSLRALYTRLWPPPPEPPRFDKLDYRSTYLGVVAALEHAHGHDEAMRRAVGGHFEALHDGHQPYVRLSQPITFEDGTSADSLGSVGQSVCVLRKPSHAINEGVGSMATPSV